MAEVNEHAARAREIDIGVRIMFAPDAGYDDFGHPWFDF